MPVIDLSYLDQSFKSDGWSFDGLALTGAASDNTYTHADLTAAADPRGNLLRVDGTLTLNGVAATHQQFQTYLNGRSLYLRVPRAVYAIHADLLALTSQQQLNVKTYLTALVGGVARWKLSNRDAVWACFPEILALTGNAQAQALAVAAAFWALDHPRDFAQNAAVDASINVPGDTQA